MQMTIPTGTWGKQSTAPAKTLPDDKKTFFAAGVYDIVKHSPTAQNHRVVEFPKVIAGRNRWVFFDDHVNCEGEDKPLRVKNVPYYSQRDNVEQWWRTCNSSTHAMLINTLKPGAVAGDDDYWNRHVNPYGDSTDHTIHTAALQRMGITSEWRTDLDYDDLDESLELGYPVPIGVYHSGTIHNPTGGHILLVIGKDRNPNGEEVYIAHDPWGTGFGANYDKNHDGSNVKYPLSSLSARWGAEGSNTGWGRIVTAIDGKPTGL